MILGIGCDIVNINRIAKSPEFLERFKQKIMGDEEQNELDAKGDLGKPELKISGNTLAYMQKLSSSAQTFITLSDDYPFAQAVVIIEK